MRRSRIARKAGLGDVIVSMPAERLRRVVLATTLDSGAWRRLFGELTREELLVGIAAQEGLGRGLIMGVKHADKSVTWRFPVKK